VKHENIRKQAQYLINNSDVKREVYECAARDFVACSSEDDYRDSINFVIALKTHDVTTALISIGNYSPTSYDAISEVVLEELESIARQSVKDTGIMLRSCFKIFERDVIGNPANYGRRFIKPIPRRPRKHREIMCHNCRLYFASNIMYHARSWSGKTEYRLCDKCYEKHMREMREKLSEDQWEHVRAFDEAYKNCEINKTCGIFAAHHDALEDDKERIKSSFLVGLTCGLEGVRKYLSSRGDFTKPQLDMMTDEELIDYIESGK